MSASSFTSETFVANWRGRNRSERAISQTHFRQLCELLSVPAPYDNPTADDEYCFDAVTATAGSRVYAAVKQARSKSAKGKRDGEPGLFGVAPPADETSEDRAGHLLDDVTRIISGKPGKGFADVWKRGCFCWEYKGQGDDADLRAALAQLRMYAPSLGNPPLLIVCDIDTFEIHTNFTNYPSEVYRFTLEDLAHPSEDWITRRGISPLNLLRIAFDPEALEKQFRPKKTLNAITEELAGKIGDLAEHLHPAKTEDGEPLDRQDLAHFLMQLVFALFAEDIQLLPADRVTRLLQQGNGDAKGFTRKVRSLFQAMEKGGDFGEDTINHFNGGLFKGVASQKIPKLTAGQLGVFVTVGRDDWSAIEPSILGTLFERALNPQKRAQIGAHYTSRDDIMLIIEPVVLAPLRRKWRETQDAVATLAAKRDAAKTKPAHDAPQKAIRAALAEYHAHLASVTILDPACGSGNFLYVAIQCLLNLEREVIAFASREDIGARLTPKVSPTQLRGIEIDPYAAELARISIWIGYLKWKHDNARIGDERPILRPLDAIETRDAILDRTHKLPTPAKWPTTDFIIGNPPFLGSKMFRKWGLTDEYLADLFKNYDLPKTSDLCCYWFERARQMIEKHPGTRAGLLATQGIRGGDNRTVLERIKKTGDIFMAWSDREWVLDGAAVQVSMVGFDDGSQEDRALDGVVTQEINADLSTGVEIATALPLVENASICFQGQVVVGDFEIDLPTALDLFPRPNPNDQRNSDVILPVANGKDVNQRNVGWFIIDFAQRTQAEAAGYEAPFKRIERDVKPVRIKNSDRQRREKWWWHGRPGTEIRAALRGHNRQLATTRVAKHRIFAWLESSTRVTDAVVVVTRSDDYFFGVLHCSLHEVWARRTGSQLREAESGFRYTPTSCFETFPLPWPPGSEPTDPKAKHHALWKEISDAAADLDRQREAWLNPAEWIAAVEKQVDIKYREELAALPKDVRPLVRRSAVMAAACEDLRLKVRTLTNLYNERPAWLRLAHERLDHAVLAAYAAVDPKGGWDPEWASTYEPFGAGNIEIREKGTKANAADKPDIRAQKQAAITARADIDAKILGALLRLNRERAAGSASPAAVKTRSPAKTSPARATKTKAPTKKKKKAAPKRKRR